jgi:large subunit ribosomal protein L21
MFAIVRTGGKQYRVAPGDKIVVEKLAGEAGDTIDLTDILLAGEGGDLQSTAGLTVGARIIAQAKADKVTVFKKRRRHNYRRKAGHRQQHTIIEIVSIGDQKAPKKSAEKSAPAKAPAEPAPAVETETAVAPVQSEAQAQADAAVTEKAPAAENTSSDADAASQASTDDAAPAKAAKTKAAPKAAAKPKK